MAASGVSYFVGRESNSVYGETLSGVQTKNAKKHQFKYGIDPFVVEEIHRVGCLRGLAVNPLELRVLEILRCRHIIFGFV